MRIQTFLVTAAIVLSAPAFAASQPAEVSINGKKSQCLIDAEAAAEANLLVVECGTSALLDEMAKPGSYKVGVNQAGKQSTCAYNGISKAAGKSEDGKPVWKFLCRPESTS